MMSINDTRERGERLIDNEAATKYEHTKAIQLKESAYHNMEKIEAQLKAKDPEDSRYSDLAHQLAYWEGRYREHLREETRTGHELRKLNEEKKLVRKELENHIQETNRGILHVKELQKNEPTSRYVKEGYDRFIKDAELRKKPILKTLSRLSDN